MKKARSFITEQQGASKKMAQIITESLKSDLLSLAYAKKPLTPLTNYSTLSTLNFLDKCVRPVFSTKVSFLHIFLSYYFISLIQLDLVLWQRSTSTL